MALVAGRPCALWTLQAAWDAETCYLPIFATDSQELQQAVAVAGIPVAYAHRSPETCTDTAPVESAVREALLDRDWQGDGTPYIVILYGNVPIRPPGLIDQAVRKLRDTGCDSVQSMTPVGKHHPSWMQEIDGDRVTPLEPNHPCRRQDLSPRYIPDGGVIAVTRDSLFSDPFLGSDRRAVITKPGEVVDIDNWVDHRVAEAILKETA